MDQKAVSFWLLVLIHVSGNASNENEFCKLSSTEKVTLVIHLLTLVSK